MLGTGFSIGVDHVMFFGLGFLICGLLALIPIPFVHARAVRLTEKKLDAASPISMKDIQTEKDMMRAEFAMTARRLETSIEELKNKASAHLGELAKKSNVIAKLKHALEEREATIAKLEANQDTLEGRVKALFDDLQIAKAEAALKGEELAEIDRGFGRSKSEITDLRLAVEERTHVIERQTTEIAALKSHIDIVRHRVADFAHSLRQSEDRLAHDWVDLMRIPSPSLSSNGGAAQTAAVASNAPNGTGGNYVNGTPQPSLNGAGSK